MILFAFLFLFPCLLCAAAKEQVKTPSMEIKAKTPTPSGTPSSYVGHSMLSQSVPYSPKALQRPMDPTFKAILESVKRKVGKSDDDVPEFEEEQALFDMEE